MRLSLFCLLFTMYSIVGSAQNTYIPYYKLINKAEEFYSLNMLDSALHYYDNAFKTVNLIHKANLEKAITVANKLKKKDKSQAYKSIMQKQLSLIDEQYRKSIDSLFKLDQSYRTARYLKAKSYYRAALKDSSLKQQNVKKYLHAVALVDEWRIGDSLIMVKLLQLISEKGYPSEFIVGNVSSSFASTIFIHFDADTCSHITGNILYKALVEGGIFPEDYAFAIDRHYMTCGKPQIYNFIPFIDESLTADQISAINQRRDEIGLKHFRQMRVIKQGKNIKVLYE